MSYNDPIFPLPEPDFLWVHDLTIHSQTAASVVVDDDGGWTYAQSASVGVVGYATAPNPREVERAASRGVVIDCIVLVPNGTAVKEEDDVTVPGSTLGFGGTAIPTAVLQGRYEVTGVRPNPSHCRVLLTRIKGEDPPHAGT